MNFVKEVNECEMSFALLTDITSFIQIGDRGFLLTYKFSTDIPNNPATSVQSDIFSLIYLFIIINSR